MGDDSTHATGEAPPTHRAVMLHGFTQTGRCLGPVAQWLAQSHDVATPDLPGHGSAGGLAHLDCPGAAEYLLDSQGSGHWIGYSLGGRVALHVALLDPGSVRSLVLIGATAGIEDRSERDRRRALDHARATELEESGVAVFTRRWLQLDMFAGLPQRARFIRERRSNTAAGLAGSLRNAGTGSMEPLWDRLAELEMPVLLLSGDQDLAFTRAAERMADSIGDNATAVSILGAGHAAHLEAPELTLAAIEEHLLDAER